MTAPRCAVANAAPRATLPALPGALPRPATSATAGPTQPLRLRGLNAPLAAAPAAALHRAFPAAPSASTAAAAQPQLVRHGATGGRRTVARAARMGAEVSTDAAVEGQDASDAAALQTAVSDSRQQLPSSSAPPRPPTAAAAAAVPPSAPRDAASMAAGAAAGVAAGVATAGDPAAAVAAAAASTLLLEPRPSDARPPAPPQEGPNLCVFSGGTAFNAVAGPLRELTEHVTYVLPVSDDGGSTAEIVRVLGGPAVGDIRSRCLRLADESDDEARAVKTLLAHRLHPSDAPAAKAEWYTIVEGDSALWHGVSEPYKHVIRAFLVHFHTSLMRHTDQSFNFSNGSIGNFFFAGSRTFFRSLEAAIFLFSRVARLPEGSQVLPAICTEERITLGAELEDGTVLRGQNQVSHPPLGDADSCSSHQVDKSQDYDLLPSPIRRVFYISSEGSGFEHEVAPRANPRMLAEVERADALIYGMGSLYTSLCPIVCLDGVGELIAGRGTGVPKLLCLNGSHDRETASSGTRDGPMTASDIVQAVCDALNRRRCRKGRRLVHKPSEYVDALLVPRGTTIKVDMPVLALMGIKHVVEVDSGACPETGAALFEPAALVRAISDTLLALTPPPPATPDEPELQAGPHGHARRIAGAATAAASPHAAHRGGTDGIRRVASDPALPMQ